MYAVVIQTGIYQSLTFFIKLSTVVLKCHFRVGLVLNGQHLLQLAADGDSRIKIEGDVELEVKPLRPYHR